MLASLTQLAPGDFTAPTLDFHALAPEIILLVTVVVLVLLDSIKLDRAKALMPAVTNLGLLAALIPLLTLAYDGTERFLFGGSYVVGSMALVLKALFIVSAYVVILLSTNYVAEGDYWESEYYTLHRVLGAGHGGHGVQPGPDRHLRGPGAAVHPGLHAGGLAQG